MSRYLYTMLFYLLLPLMLLRLFWRGLKAPAYLQRWPERFGYFPFAVANQNEKPSTIWVHAVSVGETIAAVPMIRHLQSNYPNDRIVVTTTTPTGSERVSAIFGESVFHVYGPYDLPGSVHRFLDKINPRLSIIMETELWPNAIHYCRARSIPVIVANARLSERSAKGYGRFATLTNKMLNDVSAIAVQNKVDGQRFLDLGLNDKSLIVTGSIKFDVTISDQLKQEAAKLKQEWRASAVRKVFIAASTHQGEDELILSAFSSVLETFPQSLLVIVPRHPERFDDVYRLCEQKGFSVARRSEPNSVEETTRVLVGDTMGEMMLFYGASDIAFIGGSLIPHGGHNMLEAAAWHLPIISGPHVFNFAEIAQLLEAGDAIQLVEGVEELSDAVMALMSDDELIRSRGASAGAVVEANKGALQNLLDIIAEQIHSPS